MVRQTTGKFLKVHYLYRAVKALDKVEKKPTVIEIEQEEELYVNEDTPHAPSPLKNATVSFPLKP